MKCFVINRKIQGQIHKNYSVLIVYICFGYIKISLNFSKTKTSGY